jgi:pyruvate/2-oxoglutarate dehydrogenase complex dihydrolipoamide dehydrogenase (E3) component
MYWVPFTNPELSSLGLSEKELKNQNISYEKLEQSSNDDDRALLDKYGQVQLYICRGNWFKKTDYFRGSMLAPKVGEIIQKLMVANTAELSINKVSPYFLATRINKKS